VKEFEHFLLLTSRGRHLLDNLRSMHEKRQRESSRPRLYSGAPRKNRRKNLGGLGSKATTASESSTGSSSLKQVRFVDELEIDLESVQVASNPTDSHSNSVEVSTLEINQIIDSVGMEDPGIPLSDTLPDVSNELDTNT